MEKARRFQRWRLVTLAQAAALRVAAYTGLKSGPIGLLEHSGKSPRVAEESRLELVVARNMDVIPHVGWYNKEKTFVATGSICVVKDGGDDIVT